MHDTEASGRATEDDTSVVDRGAYQRTSSQQPRVWWHRRHNTPGKRLLSGDAFGTFLCENNVYILHSSTRQSSSGRTCTNKHAQLDELSEVPQPGCIFLYKYCLLLLILISRRKEQSTIITNKTKIMLLIINLTNDESYFMVREVYTLLLLCRV
jgi:hypothetical protein